MSAKFGSGAAIVFVHEGLRLLLIFERTFMSAPKNKKVLTLASIGAGVTIVHHTVAIMLLSPQVWNNIVIPVVEHLTR